MKKNKILLNGNLFKISKQLKIEPEQNLKQKRYFQTQLDIYEDFSRYCFLNQKILPLKLYAALDKGKNKIVVDYDLERKKYKFLFHKILDFKGEEKKDEFVDLHEVFSIKQHTTKIKFVCNIEWFLHSQEEIKNLPQIVLTAQNKSGVKSKIVFWRPSRANLVEKFKADDFNNIQFELELDFKKYEQLAKNNEAKFYLYNSSKQKIKLRKVKSIFYSF